MEHFDGVRALGGYLEKHQIRRAFRKRIREGSAIAESFTSDAEIECLRQKGLGAQGRRFDDEHNRERGRFLPNNVGEGGLVRARNPVAMVGRHDHAGCATLKSVVSKVRRTVRSTGLGRSTTSRS